jgi:HEAT repeat protein
LTDPNVPIRRNVALVLLAAGGSFGPTIAGFANRDSLSALIAVLQTRMPGSTNWPPKPSAQSGPDASSAVPALLALLGPANEGSRNSACLGLTGIGVNTREALPALRQALSDPSVDVKWFARKAIDTIEKQR